MKREANNLSARGKVARYNEFLVFLSALTELLNI